MSGTPIRLTIEQGLATITLARPDTGNAIDLAMADALADAIDAVAADTTVRAVLLAAEGRNFCVGGNVRAFADEADAPAFIGRLANRLHDGVKTLATVRAPVVAAVQGAAAGAGLGLAVGADLVVAGRSASFLLAYGALGLAADGGASWLLPRLIGLRRTQDMALTNRRLSAAEAESWGLVTRVVDDEAVADEALALATSLARGPTNGFAAMKRLFAQSYATDLPAQLDAEARAMATTMATEDAARAVAAFVERRPPSFTGS